MANTTTTIRLSLPQTLNQLDHLSDRFKTGGVYKLSALSELENLLAAIRTGAVQGNCSAEVQIGCTAHVRASQTYTFASAATAGKVFTINSKAFTAKSSGATGDQFNVGHTISESATALAAAINASSTSGISGVVFAIATGAAANCTVAFSSSVNTDYVTLNGVRFTVKTNLTSTSQSSLYYIADPSANACELKVGGTNTAMGDAFAAGVNNHPKTMGLVKASNSSGTVTLTAKEVGTSGNAITISKSGSPITITTNNTGFLADGCASVGASTGLTMPAAGVCKVYAMVPGAYANAITTTTDDSGCTAGGSTMAGGAGDNKMPVLLSLS